MDQPAASPLSSLPPKGPTSLGRLLLMLGVVVLVGVAMLCIYLVATGKLTDFQNKLKKTQPAASPNPSSALESSQSAPAYSTDFTLFYTCDPKKGVDLVVTRQSGVKKIPATLEYSKDESFTNPTQAKIAVDQQTYHVIIPNGGEKTSTLFLRITNEVNGQSGWSKPLKETINQC